MKLVVKISLVAICVYAISFCSKSNNDKCFESTTAKITYVKKTTAAYVNKNDTIAISFNIISNCGKFDSIYSFNQADTIVVQAGVEYNGCNCVLKDSLVTQNYIFKPTKIGTYYFKFWQNDTAFIRDSIKVQ